MSAANSDSDLTDPNQWSIEDEVHLLYSGLNNKPVGIDKHFQMSIIWQRFTLWSNKMTSSDNLWKKLSSLYNLKRLDEIEIIPFNNDEEEFKLPSEIIPESFLKTFTDEEKRNVDFSGTYKKYLTISESEDEDSDGKSQFKLKANDKLKWFEHPQSYNSAERPKLKPEPSEGDDTYRKFSDEAETKKVIRQYGKAGEVSSGTILTVHIPTSEIDESLENLPESEAQELKASLQSAEPKNVNSDRVVKIKRRRSKISRSENSTSSDSLDNVIPVKQAPKVIQTADSVASTTRSRKASIVNQDISLNVEDNRSRSPVQSTSDESTKNARRRMSQRVSSISEGKSESSSKSGESSKVEIKRKSLARR